MTSPDQKRPRRSGWPTAFILVALIFAAVILAIFLRLESWPGRTAARTTAEMERIGRGLRDAFVQVTNLQPRVTINDRVIFEQTSEAAELATASRVTEVEHEFMHTWAGSTKRIKLNGRFIVKAGFDLKEQFTVDVREHEIAIQLPAARVLGVEQERTEVLEFQNGYWNRISPDDLETELAALHRLAREKAESSGLPREAETMLQRQLEEKIEMTQPIRVTFGPLRPKG